ncbi:hypothetical protein K501DRAFT_337314 [Backusella circina FSU 941]|nr:hypothetical protein K501DRAFT_337314 [Backusella circina FSU 941]
MDQIQLEPPHYAYIYRLRLQHEIALANDLSILLNLILFMLSLFYSNAYKDATGRCLHLFVIASILTNMISKWLIQMASSLLYSFDMTVVCSTLCWFFGITSRVLGWMAVFQIGQHHHKRKTRYIAYVIGTLLILCGLAISADLVYYINVGFNINDQVYLPLLLQVERVLSFALLFLFLLLLFVPSMTSWSLLVYLLLQCIVTLTQDNNVLYPAIIMASKGGDVNALVGREEILRTVLMSEVPAILANGMTLFYGKIWIEKR